jgi:hypothetical protein
LVTAGTARRLLQARPSRGTQETNTAVALVVRLGQFGWVVGEVAPAASPALARFVRQKTVLVTTYRQDGRPGRHPGEPGRRR